MNENDTFERLKRTTYWEVWERCRVYASHSIVPDGTNHIAATKKACGWSEDEFMKKWIAHGANWERFDVVG